MRVHLRSRDKMAVTPFDTPQWKILFCTHTFIAMCELLTMNYWRWNFYTARKRIHAGICCVCICCGPFSVLWPWSWPDDLHM